MLIHATTLLGLVFTLTASAAEPRPFAPLPIDSQLSFRTKVVVFAGHSVHRLKAANGVECELRLSQALPKDVVLEPTTALTVVGGSVQRVRWNGREKTITWYRANAIGESEGIAAHSGRADVASKIRFAAAMAAYGGRPNEIAAGYGVGGLQLRRAEGDTLSLLCSKGFYASGGTFPGLPALEDAAELIDVKLAE